MNQNVTGLFSFIYVSVDASLIQAIQLPNCFLLFEILFFTVQFSKGGKLLMYILRIIK